MWIIISERAVTPFFLSIVMYLRAHLMIAVIVINTRQIAEEIHLAGKDKAPELSDTTVFSRI